MTDTQTKKPRRAKRRRGRPRDETVHYVLEIKDWDWGFSFGVNRMKDRDDPYMEFRHLQLRVSLVSPANAKVQEAEMTLMPDERLNESARKRDEPRSVGSLQLYRGRMTGLLPMPADALAPVLQMMIAGRFRFVVLESDRIKYGHAFVRHYRLEMSLGEDDLPAGE